MERNPFLYSPDPVANPSAFCSFGYASLVGTLSPLPCKGAALDPRGGPVPLDSHARIRSLIMRCAMLFSFSHSPLPTNH